MIVKSIPNAKPNSIWNIAKDRKCSLGIYFVKPNKEVCTLGEIESTSLNTHDLEHLVWSVGFSLEEEAHTGSMNQLFNKTSFWDLFSKKRAKLEYDKYLGYDTQPFMDVLDYIQGFEKGNETYSFKISCLNGKLVVEKLV